MPNDFVEGHEQVAGLLSILVIAFDGGGVGAKLTDQRLATSRRQSAAAAGEKEIFGAVLLMNFIFVGKIVANRGDTEVTAFDQRLYGFHDGRFERGSPVLI